MADRTCTGCRWFEGQDIVEGVMGGTCHREPPTIVVSVLTGEYVTKFPEVTEHDWCGRYDGTKGRVT